MARFYQPDLSQNIDSPFMGTAITVNRRRCSGWTRRDHTLLVMMVNGIGENANDRESASDLS